MSPIRIRHRHFDILGGGGGHIHFEIDNISLEIGKKSVTESLEKI